MEIEDNYLEEYPPIEISRPSFKPHDFIRNLNGLYLELSDNIVAIANSYSFSFEKGIYYFPRGLFPYTELGLRYDNPAIKDVGYWYRPLERITPIYANLPVLFKNIKVGVNGCACAYQGQLCPYNPDNFHEIVYCDELLQKYIDKGIFEFIELPNIKQKQAAIKIQRWFRARKLVLRPVFPRKN